MSILIKKDTMREITRSQLVEVFTYLDDFIDMMINIDETPEELKQQKEEYIHLKSKVSEETRIELYAKLFQNYVQIIRKENE